MHRNYLYGFGGQHKENEVAGIGNHYTAPFWEYDPRLGRRWNVDLIRKPWESSYATFSNNPIVYNDPSGLTSEQKVDTKNKTVDVTTNIYYNKNNSNLQKAVDGAIADKDNNWDGKSVQVEHGKETYTVNYHINYVGLDDDVQVSNAMKNDLSGNLLKEGSGCDGFPACYYDGDRSITLSSAGLNALNHEVGHALGLPHAFNIDGANMAKLPFSEFYKGNEIKGTKEGFNGVIFSATGLKLSTPKEMNPIMSYANGSKAIQNAEVYGTVKFTLLKATNVQNTQQTIFHFIQSGQRGDGNQRFIPNAVTEIKK